MEYSDVHVGDLKRDIHKLLNSSLNSSHVRYAFHSSSEYTTKSGFILDSNNSVCAALIINDYHFRNTILIDLLVTDAEYRGLGLGSLLVFGYQHLFKKNKNKSYKLHVKASETALDFWLKPKFCFKYLDNHQSILINKSIQKNQGCKELQFFGSTHDINKKFLDMLKHFEKYPPKIIKK